MTQTIKEFVAENIDGMLSQDEARLFRELGAATLAAEQATSTGAELSIAEAATEFGREDLAGLGRKLFNRVSNALRGIVCGDSDADISDRNKILDALKLGDQAAITALSVAVVAALGITGPIAVLVSTIIIGRLVGGAIDFATEDLRGAVCEAWSEQL